VYGEIDKTVEPVLFFILENSLTRLHIVSGCFGKAQFVVSRDRLKSYVSDLLNRLFSLK